MYSLSEISPFWQPAGFTVMVKAAGSVCNLACSHCCYLPKTELFPESNFWMSEDFLEEFTRQYIAQRIGFASHLMENLAKIIYAKLMNHFFPCKSIDEIDGNITARRSRTS